MITERKTGEIAQSQGLRWGKERAGTLDFHMLIISVRIYTHT